MLGFGISRRLRASPAFIFRKSFGSNRFSVIHFRGINKLDFSVNQRFYHSHLAMASVVVPVLVSHGVVVIVGNSVVVFVRAFLMWASGRDSGGVQVGVQDWFRLGPGLAVGGQVGVQ